jgi:hypothetical protein
MERRTLLGTVASTLAGFAGCIQNSGTTADTATPTDSPTPTPTGTPESPTQTATANVTVENVVLQRGYVTPTTPDSIGVRNGGRQYLVASVTVDGPVAWDTFALRVDEELYSPVRPDRFYRTRWGGEEWYERGRSGGLVAFEIQDAPESGTVALRWPDGASELDGSIRERIDLPAPQFSASLALPETVEGIDAPPVDIEVTNEGDAERRFIGALNRSGPWIASAPLGRQSTMVAPGETVTITVGDSWRDEYDDERIGDGEADVTYRLDYAGGDDDADIRITDPN